VSPTSLPTMDELSDTPTPLSKLTTLLNLISSKTRLSTLSSLRLETLLWLLVDETWVDQVLSFTGRDIWVVSISFTSGMSLTELSLPGTSCSRSLVSSLHPSPLFLLDYHTLSPTHHHYPIPNPNHADPQTLQHFRHWRGCQGPGLPTQG